MNNLLDDFFNKTTESEFNQNLQELSYNLPKSNVLDYIRAIINIPIIDFLDWIDCHTFVTIDSSDVPQLSNYEDAFYNIVNILIENGDTGYRYIEMGKMLQNDGVVRNEIADRKYGENHAKAAEYLGYLYSLKFYYYVSCLGYCVNDLDDSEKKRFFVRLLLRTNLFKFVYLCTKNGPMEMSRALDILSPSTYRRRLSSLKLVLNSLKESNEYNFNTILKNIIY